MPPIALPPPDLALHTLLYTILPALTAAAAATAFVLILGRSNPAPDAGAVGLACGVALGLWLNDIITFMPGDASWNRLPWLALAALWAGRVARLPDLQPAGGWFVRGVTALAIAWLVIPTETRRDVDWLAPFFAVVLFALWLLLELLASSPPGGGVLLLMAGAFFVASIVLIHAATRRLMDIALVHAAALAGVAAVAAWRRADVRGVAPGIAVMLPGLLLMGQQTTPVPNEELAWLAFVLPALAPLLLVETLALREGLVWRVRLAQWVLMLIPLGIALYLALLAGPLSFD